MVLYRLEKALEAVLPPIVKNFTIYESFMFTGAFNQYRMYLSNGIEVPLIVKGHLENCTMEIKVKKIDIRRQDDKPSRTQRGRFRTEKSKIYIFIEKETIIENLVNRRSRPVTEYRKLLPEILKAFEEKTGYKPEKVSWSQRAGCPCGCSPGFIIQGSYGWNVFVEIGAKEQLKIEQPKIVLIAIQEVVEKVKELPENSDEEKPMIH